MLVGLSSHILSDFEDLHQIFPLDLEPGVLSVAVYLPELD